jgi:prolyl-tRNA editing enzyme YbaK/EbsC (Cys-tRNA(Pro) deacylase)
MLSTEEKVISALERTRVSYEIVEIDPEFSDTEVFCSKYGYPPEQTCNTIIVTSKRGPKKYAACVVLSHTRLDVNKRVAGLLGTSKASFAPAEEVKELTEMQLGGVTTFALPEDLPLYVDQRVIEAEWVILGGGSRRLKIKVDPRVLIKLGGQVVPDLALDFAALV